jgi:hypothetical protein
MLRFAAGADHLFGVKIIPFGYQSSQGIVVIGGRLIYGASGAVKTAVSKVGFTFFRGH